MEAARFLGISEHVFTHYWNHFRPRDYFDEEIIKPDAVTYTLSTSVADLLTEELSLDEYIGRIIRHYLGKYDNNVLKVADKLKVGKSTIYRLLKEGKV